MSDVEEDDAAFAELSDLLRVAHRRVRSLPLPDEEKASATRHLLVISDASKHDVPRALSRLRRFLDELPEPPQTP